MAPSFSEPSFLSQTASNAITCNAEATTAPSSARVRKGNQPTSRHSATIPLH